MTFFNLNSNMIHQHCIYFKKLKGVTMSSKQQASTSTPMLISETLNYEFEDGIISVSSSGVTSQIAVYNRSNTRINTKMYPYSTEDKLACRNYVRSLTNSRFFREWHTIVIQTQSSKILKFQVSVRNQDSVEIQSAFGKSYFNYPISDTANIRRCCMQIATSL